MNNENLNPHDINPQFCPDWSDTVSNCAAALEALLALDFASLTDRAGASGVGMLLEPIIGALDGALALEAKCITLDRDESARLRALAMSRHNGDVRAAIASALNLAEQPAPEPTPAEDADPGWSVDLLLSETEQQMLGDFAARAHRGDTSAAASGLLSAALRAHADAVSGGTA